VGAEDGHFYYLPEFEPPPKREVGPPKQHLVALWDFKGENPLEDHASAGKNADTLQAIGDAVVKNGVAVVPKSVASFFEAKSSPDLEFSDEFTIWLRVRIGDAPGSYQSLIDKRTFGKKQQRSYGLFIPPAKPGKTVAVGGQISQDGKGVAVARMQGKPCLPVGEWCDVALVLRRVGMSLQPEWYVGSPGQLKLIPGPDQAGVLSVFQGKQPLLIGNDANRRPGQADLEFREIRLYDRALTVPELKALGE
jgi:hypothetical protein